MRTLLLMLLTLGALWATPVRAQEDCETCYTPASRIMLPSMERQFSDLCDITIQRDPGCQGIEESKRLRCNETQRQNRAWSGHQPGQRLLSCVRRIATDMLQLGDMIMKLIKFLVGSFIRNHLDMISFMTDANFRAESLRRSGNQSRMMMAFLNGATRNFAREFPINYRAEQSRHGAFDVGGNSLRALGTTLLAPFLKMVTDSVTAIAQSQIEQFQCLNGQAKWDAICSMAAGFILPPAAIFGFLKYGIAGIKAVAVSKQTQSFMAAARSTFARVATAPRAAARTVTGGGRGATRAPPAPRPAAARPAPAAAPPRPREGVPPAPDAPAALPEGRAVPDVPAPAAGAPVAPVRGVASADELARAAALSDEARIVEAQTLLGRELSESQRTALLDAHNVGRRGPDGQMLPESEWRGYGTYTAEDIAQKARILADNGFDMAERRLLMDRGIAGGIAPGRVDADALRVLRREAQEAIVEAERHLPASYLSRAANPAELVAFREATGTAGEIAERAAVASGMEYYPTRTAWETFEKAGRFDDAARLRLAFMRARPDEAGMASGISYEIRSFEEFVSRNPTDIVARERLATLRQVDDALRRDQGLPTRADTERIAREAARREATEKAAREAAEREAAERLARETAEREAAEAAARNAAASTETERAAQAAVAADRARAVDWPSTANASAYDRAARLLTDSVRTGNGETAAAIAERVARLPFDGGFQKRTEFIRDLESNFFRGGAPLATDLAELRRLERVLDTVEPVWNAERVQPGKLPVLLDSVRTAIRAAESAP